jgi:hypothetical protein
VSSHTGDYSVDSGSNTLQWSVPTISSDQSTGALEFSVETDDTEAFYPVKASFIAPTSLAGVLVAAVTGNDDGEEVTFSQDATVSADEYQVA